MCRHWLTNAPSRSTKVGIEELRCALSITNGQGAKRVTVPTTTPPTRARVGPSQQDVGHER